LVACIKLQTCRKLLELTLQGSNLASLRMEGLKTQCTALFVLAGLVDETLLESVVRPRQHASRGLAPDLSLRLLHHEARFKIGEEDGFVGLDKCRSSLLVQFVDQISHTHL